MKKTGVCILAMLVMLAVGCGAQGQGSGTQEEEPQGTEASGDEMALTKPQPAPQSTPEMEKENEANRKPVQEAAADSGQTPQEEAAPDSGQAAPGEGQTLLSAEDLYEPEIQGQDVTEEIPEKHRVNKLQIVFLGDSILDGYRNETGIADLTGMYCDADVYNLAMGGTTAALSTDESAEYEKWTSRCLQGVVHVICGNVGDGLLDGHKAKEVYESCDFSDTDYFVLEYGMNDFLSSIPLNDEGDVYDPYTYVGALRIAVQNLRESYPDAQIVLCSPNYAHFWSSDGKYLGDGNMSSNGVANLVEYHRVCGNVANDMKTLFMDGYEGIGLDAYTADEYLEDGIHLSEKGREAYAKKLSQIILKCEETRNN